MFNVLICIDDSPISLKSLKFYLENYSNTNHQVHIFTAVVQQFKPLVVANKVSENLKDLIHNHETKKVNIEEKVVTLYKLLDKAQDLCRRNSTTSRKNSNNSSSNYNELDYIFKQEYVDRKGKIGEAIVNYANSISANMIVTGTRNLKGIDKFMLGSVSDYVMRKCECPVMIIKEASE